MAILTHGASTLTLIIRDAATGKVIYSDFSDYAGGVPPTSGCIEEWVLESGVYILDKWADTFWKVFVPAAHSKVDFHLYCQYLHSCYRIAEFRFPHSYFAATIENYFGESRVIKCLPDATGSARNQYLYLRVNAVLHTGSIMFVVTDDFS